MSDSFNKSLDDMIVRAKIDAAAAEDLKQKQQEADNLRKAEAESLEQKISSKVDSVQEALFKLVTTTNYRCEQMGFRLQIDRKNRQTIEICVQDQTGLPRPPFSLEARKDGSALVGGTRINLLTLSDKTLEEGFTSWVRSTFESVQGWKRENPGRDSF